MNGRQHPLRRLVLIGLLFSGLAGCVVVPYGSARYYDYPERVYGPPVVVPAPFFYPYGGPHWHHGHRRHR